MASIRIKSGKILSGKIRFGTFVAVLLAMTSACSNGGSSSGDGDNGADRDSNSAPRLQLNDGDVLGGGNSIIRFPAADDTGIVRVSSTIVRQGRLEQCVARFADSSLVANSLIDACLTDQPGCAVTFQPVSGEVEVIPPPLYAPVGVEYDLSVVDRDGTVTDPVRAIFCFDVGLNAAPVAVEDVFQLTYPSRIERSGVIFNDRCEKQEGSQGVLFNDDDDEHVSNTCLTAELVELPRFASNLSNFRSTFGANGSFVYEAFGDIPPEDSDGRTFDTFTYRVTDGVNPVSDPVRVEVVYGNGNQPPQAADDSFDIAEDSDVQVFAVLDNDIDPDALPLSVIAINNGPGNGVANIRNGILIEYRPQAGFVGQDRFTYTAQDSGGLTVTANVTINITNVNDAPQARNDVISTNENTSVNVDVLANDSDEENDTLQVVSVASALNGSTVLANGVVTYTPDANYSGPDSFEYTISDGSATATATVVVAVVFVNVAPGVSADQLSLDAGTSAVVNVLANDSDGDGDELTVISVGDPANGTAAILTGGDIRYTPDSGFSGQDAFSYTVSDGTVQSTAQVTVVVNSVNQSPVAANDTASTEENAAVVIDVLTNDTDPDGDSLSIAGVSNVRSGAASISTDRQTVTFTPADSFSGQAGFSYSIEDGNGGSDTATVTVLVSNSNANPVAVDDVRSTEEDDPVSIDVLANDSDPDNDSLSLSVLSQPDNGAATVNAQGTRIIYSPDAGFSGTDVFTYQVSDGEGGTSSATVTVTVTNQNTAPVAANDAIQLQQGASTTVNVLANDSDPDGDALSVSLVTPPANGAATVLADNTISYTPVAAFSGTDSLVYSISDGQGGTATATVNISVSAVVVNNPPIAVDDVAQVSQDQAINVDVLGNDSDQDNDTLTVSIVTPPSNGSASVLANNTISYTPLAAFAGSDAIVYSIADGQGGTATATVTITVTAVVVNNPPSAEDDVAQATQGQSVNFNILANDTDPDGDSLTVTITTPPANGVATVMADNRISYTPDATFSGADSIGYTVSDGNGGTDTAVVSITVATSNTAPNAIDDSASANQDQATPVNIPVLANDTDPDGDPLSVAAIVQPVNGSVVADAAGVLAYTPDAGFAGIDTFSYDAVDPDGASRTAIVTVTVNAVITNVLPVADVDTATTPEDTAVVINVLANDTDADGDTLTVSAVATPANGTATLNADDSITYTPVAGFVGSDTFSYTIDDGVTGTATASVTITVTAAPVAVNNPPVAVDDVMTVTAGSVTSISVLGNDTDADADNLTVAVDATLPPALGTVSVINNGIVLEYTAESQIGTDTFGYIVSDGNGGSDSAIVTIEILSP